MTADPLLLLVGASAVALAPRLAASGYSTVDWLSAGVASSTVQVGEEPLAAVLAADQAAMVRDLRQRFRGMPILLDLEQDSVDARAKRSHTKSSQNPSKWRDQEMEVNRSGPLSTDRKAS